MPAVISFIGWHDSGKTTLASRVVAELLRRGRKVAVVKSTKERQLSFDHPGTDSALYLQAGAAILVAGPELLVLQKPEKKSSLKALAARFFADMELVVGEGFKHEEDLAKIEVFRDTGPRLASMVDGVVAVVGCEQFFSEIKQRFSSDDFPGIADFLEDFIELSG